MGGIPWTTEENQLLRKCIEKYGEGKWHRVPQLAGLRRCRKSCRLRWLNYLRPNIKRGSFEQDEVDLIIKLQRLLGNRWSLVAARLPGRTGNDVKNYWNCHLSKKLIAQEAHDDQEKISHNPHVIPLPSKFSKSNSKRSVETSRTALEDQSFPAMEESSRSGSMAMLCNVDDEDKGQMVQVHEQVDSNNTCVEKDHDGYNDFLGDLGLVDLDEFEQDQYDQVVHNSKNKWVWDDSILDMDLWSTDSS